MNSPTHWDKIYTEKAPDQVSWYRPHLEASLLLIEQAGVQEESWKESKLSYLGHALVENRNGLIAAAMARRRLRRARCGAVNACRNASGPLPPHHGGRRQGLRHEGFCEHGAGTERDAACYEER